MTTEGNEVALVALFRSQQRISAVSDLQISLSEELKTAES